MLKIKDEGIILEKTDLPFENKGVFNPACIKVNGVTHMFYRAINKQKISSIGYCQIVNNKVIKRLDRPILSPWYNYEKRGVEDPRIVFLDGLYYLFYTAFDGQNALVAYAVSKDLINFSKKGLISPKITYDEAEDIFRDSGVEKKYILFEQIYKKRRGHDVLLWEKDASLFPKKIRGKFALMHRILPGIQIMYFDDFSELTNEYWRKYLKELKQFVIIDPKYKFENRNIGGGCPPIETPRGWLLISHAVENTKSGKVYRAGAVLVDLNDPTKVVGLLKKPLFSPKKPWEKKGNTNNVVFPTGAVLENGILYIYYGAADTCIAAKSIKLNDLLEELTKEGGN
ncbi:MAG: glycosidase-like protein [Microgenomates group bacterium LiPW_31]|nr:MAG: glycosidase-like protein [Microgenomates group bacterium LiPW_31]